jgi:hypothetical protein
MRQFKITDLSALYRYQTEAISLDGGYTLTRGGNLLGTAALLEQIGPDSQTTLAVQIEPYTKKKILGQMYVDPRTHTAKMNFLAPQDLSGTLAMKELIEGLCKDAGERGAVCVRAGIEVGNEIYGAFKEQKFRLYDRLRIWYLPPQNAAQETRTNHWSVVHDTDFIGIRHLYAALVPPLVQAAQPLMENAMPDLVYWQDNEIMGSVESMTGPGGIFLCPLLHPAIQENAGPVLYQALHHYLPLMGRPVFVAVPSYQGWLESVLYKLQAEVVSLRSLMVRYLAQPLRVPELETARRTLDKVRMHPSHLKGKGGDVQ